jgi:hypothetical protein
MACLSRVDCTGSDRASAGGLAEPIDPVSTQRSTVNGSVVVTDCMTRIDGRHTIVTGTVDNPAHPDRMWPSRLEPRVVTLLPLAEHHRSPRRCRSARQIPS